MRGVEHVVSTLFAAQETAQPVILAYGGELVAAARDDLVGVGLMSYVYDQLVARRIESVMDCQKQLDGAEACARVAADFRQHFDHVLANLICEWL